MRIKNAILVLMSFVATGFGVTAFSYAHNTPVEEAVKTSFWSDTMIAYLITFGIMVVYSFITGAVSLGLSINSKKSMKIGNALLTKILMIPFFVVNFMYWFPYIFGLGFLSMIGIVILPFALFAIPAILLGVISVTGTYIIMFSTSANLIVPFIKKIYMIILCHLLGRSLEHPPGFDRALKHDKQFQMFFSKLIHFHFLMPSS